MSEKEIATGLLERLIGPIARDDARRCSQALIDEFGSLNELAQVTVLRLSEVAGRSDVGMFLYDVYRAVEHMLLARVAARPVIASSQAVADYLKLRIGCSNHEELHAFYLDAGNGLLRAVCVSSGTPNGTVLIPRDLIARALELGAVSIVLAHNHPSGLVEPSENDIQATASLVEGAKLFGIRVLDHLIVGRDQSLSMRMNGFFSFF